MHKKRDKKAISNVIILVLLILISILAVLIFWMMLRGLLKENAEEIYFSKVDVEVKGYDYAPGILNGIFTSSGGNISLIIFRGTGIGEQDISFLRFTFNTEIKEYQIEVDENLNMFEESTFRFPIATILMESDADFNGDKVLNYTDVEIFAFQYWGGNRSLPGSNYCECADFDGSGNIDVVDLLTVGNAFSINPFESARIDAYTILPSGKEILVGSTKYEFPEET